MNSTSPTPNDNKLAQQTPARPPLKSLDDALLELLANASPLTSVEDVLLQLAVIQLSTRGTVESDNW
jgi:hypothetical protein